MKNPFFKKKNEEWEKRVIAFGKELKELCLKHGIDIRGKITAYGPALEYFKIEEDAKI